MQGPAGDPPSALGDGEMEQRRVQSDLTIIVPTVGRPILRKCLESIGSGQELPGRLILVDQGENPEVGNWLRMLGESGVETSYLSSAERSPASARNRGIEQVQSTLVAAIDDDCTVEGDWVEKMEKRLRQYPSAIITGRLVPAGNGIPPTKVTSTVPRVYSRPSVRIHSPLASANMGFALETARLVGPFDEELGEAEENDWAYRALRLGVPIVYAPELVVYHSHWRNEKQLRATFRAYGWSQGAFYGKHLRRGDWSMVLRAAISLGRGVRGLLKGVSRNDFAMKAESTGRLEYLLPGMVAGAFRRSKGRVRRFVSETEARRTAKDVRDISVPQAGTDRR